MNSTIKAFLILIFVLSPLLAIAQEEEFYDYSSEFIWGINKSSNSGIIGGFIFKVGREKKEDVFETFGMEIINVKHPQEDRRQNFSGGSGFIWAKLNYLYSFRFQYGRDFVLFKKARQQGAQVTLVTAAGPSLGIVTPYYVEIGIAGTGSTRTLPFNEDIQPGEILGPGRLFEGLGESNVKFGFNAKAALNFEFGTFKSNVTGFEVGFLVEAFTSEIPLAAFHKNTAVFPSAFINLFYGSRK
jgi:hypothetical protein